MGQTSGDWGAEQVTKAGPLWSQVSDSALQCGLSQLCPWPWAAAVQWTLLI